MEQPSEGESTWKANTASNYIRISQDWLNTYRVQIYTSLIFSLHFVAFEMLHQICMIKIKHQILNLNYGDQISFCNVL